ncbi:MAG: metallophosphoesterase [Cyclobacteriaceae bacterium]|nr:metallophosphoesterase [Cyclobacteriaceae bacterium]
MIYIVLLLIFLIDWYVFQAVKVITKNWTYKKSIWVAYWSFTVMIILILAQWRLFGLHFVSQAVQRYVGLAIMIDYLSKLFAVLFLLLDDGLRLFKWVKKKQKGKEPSTIGKSIPRSEFLAKASIVAIALPIATLGFGILSGAYDYRVRRKRVVIPNLPKAFDGIKIGQLSDIHSGSFYNKTAVQGGIDLMIKEKPDIFMFTGDLVNNETSEVGEYKDMFAKLSAPLGAYSTLGNHDYGDYKQWNSATAKEQNLNDLAKVHKDMGWDLLRNENRIITVDGEQIAILGVENWGKGRFAKYGDLDKAYAGSEEVATKILLSHDPSHWDMQVRPNHPDIDLMLAGHTHGFQFGVEIGNFRWSPSQYIYKQWADLYQEDNQQLYVNRGFGFLGYPGRVGILPEITILELVRA